MNSKASGGDLVLESAVSVLRRLPVPKPSPDLLSRILASRAKGARVVLPGSELSRTRRALRYAVAAAAFVGVAWFGFKMLSPRPERRGGPLLPSVLDGTPFMPAAVFSQEVRRTVRAARYRLISELEPDRVRAGRWIYEQRRIGDGVFVASESKRTVRLARFTYQGKPAWLVTGYTRDTMVLLDTPGARDTIVVDASSMRPVRNVRPMWRTRLIQQFSPDSMVEEFHVMWRGPERTMRHEAALPDGGRGPLLLAWSAYSLEAVAQALPLARHWEGSVYSVGGLFASEVVPAFTALDLRVTGTERITVPAGTFDCWKLQVREGDEESTVWVSQQQRWLVMRSRTFEDSGKLRTEWRVESRLVAVDATGGGAAPGP